MNLKEYYMAVRDYHGEGQIYKPDTEALHEMDACNKLLLEMDLSSDLRYPYNSKDKSTNNYLYSVALLED